MSSVNKVILVGRLGEAPELMQTSTGDSYTHLSLATDAIVGKGQQPKTDWFRVTVWGKTAETCSKYLGKGRQVYVEGRLQNRSWVDPATGSKKYSTDIVASQVTFLGSKGDGGQPKATRVVDPLDIDPGADSYIDPRDEFDDPVY